jgi:hypothetical protein
MKLTAQTPKSVTAFIGGGPPIGDQCEGGAVLRQGLTQWRRQLPGDRSRRSTLFPEVDSGTWASAWM